MRTWSRTSSASKRPAMSAAQSTARPALSERSVATRIRLSNDPPRVGEDPERSTSERAHPAEERVLEGLCWSPAARGGASTRPDSLASLLVVAGPGLGESHGPIRRKGVDAMNALEVRGLRKTYESADAQAAPVRALRGVDLTMYEGEFVAVMGPPGVGESTLLNLVAGVGNPTPAAAAPSRG